MRILILLLVFTLTIVSCQNAVQNLEVKSPNKYVSIVFGTTEQGKPYYVTSFRQNTVIDTSYLGFEFTNAKQLLSGLEIINSNRSVTIETWQMPWGEQLDVTNNYTQLQVELQELNAPKRKVNIVFKVYDDGIGFRYEFPEQKGWTEALIKDEHTEFNLTE
ncbi:MAG: glycoside hydrolase family 97 protein, partial [Winogradskyella sp.]|nr:glycoside hydrolase family 97 protein [Winogradskyella sp.]